MANYYEQDRLNRQKIAMLCLISGYCFLPITPENNRKP